MAKVAQPKRGEIYLVDFEPARGAEIKKTRPALIIQNDVANRYSPITIIVSSSSIEAQPLPELHSRPGRQQ